MRGCLPQERFHFGDVSQDPRALLSGLAERVVRSPTNTVQHDIGGYLTRDSMDAVAQYLGLPPVQVYEVASFYDMYNTVPVGRIQVRVCTTTPCWLCGSDDVVRACKDTLGVGIGDSTPDGRFFLREFECLGACANAPILWIDDDFYEDIYYAGTKAVLEALMRGERPTPGPQNGRKNAMPLGGKTTLLDAGD